MKFLLFNWDNVKREVLDVDCLSDEEFEEVVKECNGFIIDSLEDFQAHFNAEHFSTQTHQLRITKTK